MITCPECGGTGEQAGPDPFNPDCVDCDGAGEIEPRTLFDGLRLPPALAEQAAKAVEEPGSISQACFNAGRLYEQLLAQRRSDA